MNNSTLFGAPLGYTNETLSGWIADLTECWVAFSESPPASLEADIAKLADAFASGTSPKKLRITVAKLGKTSERISSLPDELAMHLSSGDLITPEGRILLSVLHELEMQGRNVVSPQDQVESLAFALETRAKWHRAWVTKQLDGTLSPAVLGAAIFLLINGSIGQDAAFLLPDDEETNLRLKPSVLSVIGEFSYQLGGNRPDLESGGSLQRHWAFTQVSRYLSAEIVRQKGTRATKIWVRRDREEDLISNLRDRLDKYGSTRARHALESLATEYRLHRGRLISLGLMHEEPAHTKALLRKLEPASQ